MPHLPITYFFAPENSKKKQQRRVKRKQNADSDDDSPPGKKGRKGRVVSTLSDAMAGTSQSSNTRKSRSAPKTSTTPPAAKYLTPKSLARPKASRTNVVSPPDNGLIDLTEDRDPPASFVSPSTSHLPYPMPPTPPFSSPFMTPTRRREALEVVPETPQSSPTKSVPSTPVKRLPLAESSTPSQIPTSQSQELEARWSPVKAHHNNSSSLKPDSQTSSSLEIVPSSQSQVEILCEATPKRLKRTVTAFSDRGDAEPVVIPSSQSQAENEFWAVPKSSVAARSETNGNIESWALADRGEDVNPDDGGELYEIPTSQSQIECEVDVSPFASRASTNDVPCDQNLPASQPLERSDSNTSFIIPIEDVDLSELFEAGNPMASLAEQHQAPVDVDAPAMPLSQSVTESESGEDDWRTRNYRPPNPASSTNQDTIRTSEVQTTVQPISTFSLTQSQTQDDTQPEPELQSHTQEAISEEYISSQYTLPSAAKDFLDLFD
ncbi:hypothetical protein D9758_001328 [Tetrapyrgos nigripes]|uniref:Uncharacterized protein n=1 Tax=Tetrapyrgos nigripes TaxID=182062 RepID=A0A8H5GSG3_9AGAR|nr:hypothetical protein D9758_001328 [Tetrapyrgos nigripes]